MKTALQVFPGGTDLCHSFQDKIQFLVDWVGGSVRCLPFLCLIIMALTLCAKELVQGFCQPSAVSVPVTDKEAKKITIGGQWTQRTHCKAGHGLDYTHYLTLYVPTLTRVMVILQTSGYQCQLGLCAQQFSKEVWVILFPQYMITQVITQDLPGEDLGEPYPEHLPADKGPSLFSRFQVLS